MTMRVLTGDRVTLHPLDRATAHAIDKNRRDGQRWAPDFPADGDVVIARVTARATPAGTSRGDSPPAPWQRPWPVEESGVIIGTVGFKGQPEDGRIELGYGLVPSARQKGLANEAVGVLLSAAAEASDIREVWVETAVDNMASQLVLEKLGFARTGQRWDAEDGALITWSRPPPSGAQAS
jgi:RimJ/RimL family protein N-acetyltransferase